MFVVFVAHILVDVIYNIKVIMKAKFKLRSVTFDLCPPPPPKFFYLFSPSNLPKFQFETALESSKASQNDVAAIANQAVQFHVRGPGVEVNNGAGDVLCEKCIQNKHANTSLLNEPGQKVWRVH